MALNIHVHDDTLGRQAARLIALKGELDIQGSEEFSRKILPMIQEGSTFLILDLHELEYINSTGIYTLTQCLFNTQEAGGSLRVVGMSDRVREILDIVGLTKVLTSYENLDQALADEDNGMNR